MTATPAVLVVEDDEDIRSLARDMLSAAGFRVLDAPDGTQALELLNEERVDLLFTDLVMPGLNGLDLAAAAAARDPALKILYTSGYAQHPALASAAAKPAQAAFLPKPYRASELVERVRGILDAG